MTDAARLVEEFYDGTAERDWPAWGTEAVAILEKMTTKPEQHVYNCDDADLQELLNHVAHLQFTADTGGLLNHDDGMGFLMALEKVLERLKPGNGAVLQHVAHLYCDTHGTLKLAQTDPPPAGAFPVYRTDGSGESS